MANHTDDCPACGKDRRGISGPCCAEARSIEAAEEAEWAAAMDGRRELLTRLGIAQRTEMTWRGIEVLPESQSLFVFLRRLDNAAAACTQPCAPS